MAGLLNRLKTRKTGSNDSSASQFFDEEGFVCPLCHQKFSDQTQLTQHYTDSHAQETRQVSSPSFSDSTTRDTALWKQQFSVSEESRILLSNELIQEKERTRNLEEELQHVQKQLKTSQAKISEQLLEIGNLKATKDVYDAQLTIFSNELLTTQNQLKEKQQQLDILSSKASSDDLDVLKHELVRIQQTMNEISIEKEKEIERLQSILNETQQKFNTIETKFQRAYSFLEKVIIKLIIPINNEINQLKQLIKKQKDKSETILKHIRNSFIEKENIIQQLNKTLEQQKQMNQSQSIQNQQLEKLLNEKAQLIETKLEDGEKQDVLRQISAEKNLFEQHNKEFRNQINELTSQRQQIQIDYEKISKQLTIISNEKNQLQNQLNNINRDKERQTNELTDLHEKYNSIREANELMIKEKQEFEKIKFRLEQNVQLIQKEKDTIVQQLQSTLSHLHIKLEHRDNRIKRLSIGIQHSIVLTHRVLEHINMNILSKQMEIFKLIETAENNARIIREKTLEDIQFEFTNSLTMIHSIICKYKNQFETNQLNLFEKDEEIKKLKNNYQSINKQYQEQKILFEQLTELTQTMDRQREKYEKQINSIEQELELRTKRHEKQIGALTENLSSVRTELKQNQEKLMLIDQIKTEKADIEARLNVSQDERRVLLERSLSNEQKNEKLIVENGLLAKKSIEVESALQEIAREYQVLQILVNKLSQRRWIDDEDVDACMKCNNTFSVTQRKHHCRNCGNIFCDNCSSKTATIAASRKQKRVCDQCYKDLTA